MLNSESKPTADPIRATAPEPASSPPSTPALGARATARERGAGPPTRFVTGARAILLLSLLCWTALIGTALLLFG